MPNERRRRPDEVPSSDALDRPGSLPEATDHAIRSRAYQLYEARGGEPGTELDDWLRAERELRESADGTEDDAA
jgi:hypothetical protein